MPLRHALLALLVAFIWGTNFVVMKLGLAKLPPFLFATLRFALVAFPLAFVLPRPAVPWRNLALYGLLIGVGQFALVFFALTRFISPGMVAVVVQTQVFFTMGLAVLLAGERIRAPQALATAIAAVGIGIIALHTDGHTTALGVTLTLIAAACWAMANIASRAAAGANALAYVVWSALFAVPPLLGLSLWLDGWPAIVHGLHAADGWTWLAVLWQSVGNSMLGYGAWAWLMGRYPAASISPFALTVPIFGLATSVWVLGEPLPGWKLLAAALVLGGLALNLVWPRLAARWHAR
ncbi:EamA family transporter [Comamonas serinivorans]|uniref:EamA family transporter n=1 Tax=Comamonas serinivorans TaxID=1082851 RepID=UPI00196B9042|nr:EamA family transporter [Comamonas serinivorans]